MSSRAFSRQELFKVTIDGKEFDMPPGIYAANGQSAGRRQKKGQQRWAAYMHFSRNGRPAFLAMGPDGARWNPRTPQRRHFGILIKRNGAENCIHLSLQKEHNERGGRRD